MNANAPSPKKIGVLQQTPILKLTLWTAYLIAKFLATTLAWPFWFAEQWRGKLADELEKQRT